MRRKPKGLEIEWQPWDEDMVLNGDPKDDKQLAEELGRTVEAIKVKRSRLKAERKELIKNIFGIDV